MNLTELIRDSFVRAVMDDVPKPNYAKLKEQAQAALVKAMAPAVAKAYKAVPKALLSRSFDYLSDRDGYVALSVGDLDGKDANKIVAEFQQPQLDRDALRTKLYSVAKGCKTVKQLRLQLPELAHYLPDEKDVTANLPVANNVMAEMVKMGWTGKVIK